MSISGAIRAGGAYIEILSDLTPLQKGLQQAARDLKGWSDSILRTGTALAAAGAGMLAPLAAAVQQFVHTGDIRDFAQRSGASVEGLSALSYAAEQTGTNLEAVTASFARMQRAIGTNKKDLSALGLDLNELRKLSPDQQFLAIAAALQRIEDPTRRASAAMGIFGRSGTVLLPMIADIRKLTADAERLGLVVSADTADAGDALGDAWLDVQKSLKAAAIEIGATIGPALTALAQRATNLIQGFRAFAALHPQIVSAYSGIAVTVAAVGASMVTVAIAARGLSAALTLIAAHPVLAAVVALTAATVALSAAMQRNYAVVLNDDWSKLLATGDRLRDAHQQQMDRLQQLAAVSRLSNDEMAEARSIIADLTSAYGDLGLRLDATTKKLGGMELAQTSLNKAQTYDAEGQLRGALKESQANARALINQQHEVEAAQSGSLFGSLRVATLGTSPEVDALQAKIDAEVKRGEAILGRLQAIRSGDTRQGVTGKPGPDAAVQAAADKAQAAKVASYRQALDDAEYRTRLARIDDAEAREIAAINHEYDLLKKRAEELGADVAEVDARRAAAIAAARQDADADRRKKAADQDKRDADDAARKAKDQAANAQELRDQIAAQDIRNNKTGLDQQIALNELERKQALRTAKERGLDEFAVNRLYDLKETDLRKQDSAAKRGQVATQVAGTFSAAVAGRIGGTNADARIASATEKSAKVLDQIERNTRGQAKFGA